MGAFDDVNLDRSERWTAPPPVRHRPGVVLAIAVLVIAAGVLGWWLTRQRGRTVAGEIAAPAPLTESRPATPTPPRTSTLPALDDLDPAVRDLVRGLTSSPLLERWLAGTNLARQMAALVEGSATGTTPWRLLAPLRPSGSFQVVSRQGRTFIAPESHSRYDALAGVVTSIDARALAETYHTLSPRLEDAHDELGVADGSFDSAFRRVLADLIELQVPRGPIAVVPRGGVYAFADPALEELSAVEKLLVRSGPDNATRIQQHLRELRDALSQSAE
jgi:hypothetical protein